MSVNCLSVLKNILALFSHRQMCLVRLVNSELEKPAVLTICLRKQLSSVIHVLYLYYNPYFLFVVNVGLCHVNFVWVE